MCDIFLMRMVNEKADSGLMEQDPQLSCKLCSKQNSWLDVDESHYDKNKPQIWINPNIFLNIFSHHLATDVAGPCVGVFPVLFWNVSYVLSLTVPVHISPLCFLMLFVGSTVLWCLVFTSLTCLSFLLSMFSGVLGVLHVSRVLCSGVSYVLWWSLSLNVWLVGVVSSWSHVCLVGFLVVF